MRACPITRRAAGAWLGAVLAAAPAAAAPRLGPAECRAAPARRDALQGVAARGEIVLASGTRAVLGSLRWPDEAEAAAAAEAWLAGRRGRPLDVVVRGEPDRWGRVRIDAADAEEAVDLAGGLVAAGFAQVDAGEGDVLCRPALLRLEEAPRRAGSGVWRRPVREAKDGAALREEAGRFVVAQGRIRNVGERPSRTYLDFVRRGEDGLTVTVSKRTWRRLQEHGFHASGLTGRVVRVRGIVEIWRGPVLDIASAEMIEVLDSDGTEPRVAVPERERALRR
ncbi:DNA-binding protein [Methylobacterium durans]|uniref:DNA-binding protein n=1 Tax=Methylobacterium durans TaxID=2202825 RepID=A0A2U8W412_9HYPH|nr:DNA-binding protein [Methylobacterium durans]AWN40809.1 DNA-binding protein [Methylobacterium durans]